MTIKFRDCSKFTSALMPSPVALSLPQFVRSMAIYCLHAGRGESIDVVRASHHEALLVATNRNAEQLSSAIHATADADGFIESIQMVQVIRSAPSYRTGSTVITITRTYTVSDETACEILADLMHPSVN